MFTLEFEVPMERFNQVMDTITWSEMSLEWVYYNETRGSAVFRLSVPDDCLEKYLLQLAVAAGQIEVTVVEKRKTKTYIHEAFLISVDMPSGSYPVSVLFKYRDSKFYPTDITIAMLPNSPPDLLKAVLNLTIGRVQISTARLVKRVVEDNAVVIHLKTQTSEGTIQDAS
ncbi:hypothetical protein E3E35_09585 [Thermococcus sp. GR7]|uniref:hypothetical protein n=1 Tax=unclassified Thermococcus TaxID=2627626 RepID=UPI00142FE670|nr:MULTISPECIES: hypothetical protein [unclassified Thermococcus]NJE47643.1 hypothetical protein [Thermococcus sp. GR7]NJE78943.1 hypothetical protein [Thermococcus sp. GR4]NJF22593.1 hypothetical protein [Thermococcus sp. GR5]